MVIERGRRGGFRQVGKIGEVRDQVGRPIDAAMTQPAGEETGTAVLGMDARDFGLVGFGGCGAEREADFGQAKLEQAIAPAALAVIIPLGRGPCEDFDLPVIEAEATINGRDLRLDGALVRQQEPRRAALDDGGRDVAPVNVGQALRGEDDAGVLLAQRFQPFAELAGETLVVQRKPAFIYDEQRGAAIEPVADTMEEMLNAYVEDGIGIAILYNYIFSEDTSDLRTADILWDYLSVLTTSVYPL